MSQQQQQPDGTTSSQQVSRRATKYNGEVLKILQTMDRTPMSNWSGLSTSLTQLLKCLEANVELAVGSALDTTLLCRVIYKCLDPKGVMGVHRKALEVLQRLSERLGALPLVQHMPLVLAAVLNLLPRCSLQVKCELLNFVDVNMLRELPAEVVALQLPGIIPALLGGLEEGGESEVYRLSLKLMGNIHDIIKTYAAAEASAKRDRDEEFGESSADSGKPPESVLRCGDAAVYRVLWFTLKNSPSLRGSALQYLKQQLDEAVNRIPGGDGDDEVTFGVHAVEQGIGSGFNHSAAPPAFFGNDLRLVFSSIFATLQEQNERTRRLMLDLLIIAFPLNDTALLTFAEKSLLVSAVVQQLGAPDSSNSTQRRVVEWLMGPFPDIASQFIREVSSFHVAQAFHQFVSWWKLHFGESPVQQQSTNVTGASVLERSCYYVLHVTACKSAAVLSTDSSEKKCGESMSPYILPITWLRALVVLFKAVVGSDMHDGDDIMSSGSSLISRDANSYDEYDGMGPCFASTPFKEHLVPLVMPYACDLLVSMEALMNRGSLQVDCVETVLDAFFASVSWEYFVNHKRGIVFLLENSADQLADGSTPLASTSLSTALDVSGCAAASSTGCPPSSDLQQLPQADNSQGLFRQFRMDQHYLEKLQSRFLQLKGMASLLQKHAIVPLRRSAKQIAAFRCEIFAICQSLCGILRSASTSALTHATAPEVPGACGMVSPLEVSLCLVEGSFQVFNLLFTDIILALPSDVDPMGNTMPDKESEIKLLTIMTESASVLTKLVAYHAAERRELLVRVNDGVLTLLSRVISSGWGRCELCDDVLDGWLHSVTSAAASSPSLAVQRDSLQLFVDFSKSIDSPTQFGESMRENRELKAQLVPRVWHLLGICSEGMQPAVVDLLLQLYADDEARIILDGITVEDTVECGERLAILFFWMAEREAPQNLFLPGLYMLLRALEHNDPSLRWIAQSTVRQFIPYLHRLLNPLLISLTRQLVCFNPAAESCGGVEKKPDDLPTYSNQELRDYEVNQLKPAEFVRVVGCILSNPASSPQLLLNMCKLPAPAYMGSRLPLLSMPVHNARSDTSGDVEGETNGESVVVGSAFAALVQVLLGIAYQNLSPRFSETSTDGIWRGGELGVAAVEALTMMLQKSQSLIQLPRMVINTWGSVSKRILELLHEVVRCRLFPPEQIAMLQHLLDSVRLISNVSPAESHSSPENKSVVVCRCASALRMDLFCETVEIGVERAAARALLPHGRSDRDLLNVWCDTLLGLMPFLHERREEVCSRVLQTFIHVIEQQARTTSSLRDCTTLRVVEVCLKGIFGVLEYYFAAGSATTAAQDSIDAKSGDTGSGWFSSRMLFASASPRIVHKVVERAVECTEVMRESIQQIVATLCKVHLCVKKYREAAPQLRSKQSQQDDRDDPALGKRVLPSEASITAEAAAAFLVETAIHRVLLFCRETIPIDFFRIFVSVWAEEHVHQLNELVKESMTSDLGYNNSGSGSDATTVGKGNDGEDVALLTIISAAPKLDISPALLSEAESMGLLLGAGASTSALALINAVTEILAEPQSVAPLVASQCEVFGSGLAFDAAALYFVHTFMRVWRTPADDMPQVLTVMMSCFHARLTAGAVSVPTLAFMLLCLSHFLPPEGTTEESEVVVVSSSAWGKEKRCLSVLCKILDSLSAVSSIASETASVDPEALYFVLNVVARVLPRAVRGLLLEHDRVTTSVVHMCKRSVFPVIAFGIDAQIDEDAHARTPLVRAALRVALAAVSISDSVPRRLRQELLDGPCNWDFFRLPKRSLHYYGHLFARLSRDRAFHAEMAQLFTPSPSQPNRFAGLVNQSSNEEQQQLQRAVQMRRLTFYVASMPSTILMSDREFCLLLREQFTEVVRTASTAVPGRRSRSNAIIYQAIFLFRVLLTKLDPALLQPFWPLVLPEIARALSETFTHSDVGAEVKNGGSRRVDESQENLLQLQLECLKVLHFAVVIVPEVIAPFRWVFMDDLNVTAGLASTTEISPTFVPLVQRLVGSEVSPTSVICDLKGQFTSNGVVPMCWSGFQRPFLHGPSILNGGPRGTQTCAAALLLLAQTRDLTTLTGCATEQQQLLTYMRLTDGWDEPYVRHLLEMDFSCVHDAVDVHLHLAQ
ncbi:hypothetical protein, conserved [Trypanosoma brucei brucei TREU927]|uniref:DOP1 N-terminal domain-containing protein n=1 Tax=Trypanosoma brucei brucei (strain 927/4 GUTat10.1) TaxID=185431 RepID=Q381C0_TRYB2|nr:hypothetical protein, conserved [Trypanosoma brucei brucei TREU927]EAN80611.1 hypothetical protein, conserved [Trypanosoma brucei brucei TREU927]